MVSFLISNPVTISNLFRDGRKKQKDQLVQKQEDQNHTKWKSQTQQQIYSSKMCQALARVNLGSSAPANNDAPRRGKAVREAVDRVLAVTAKGRTRWSRAILTNQSKKPRARILQRKGKSRLILRREVRLLSWLIPGCRNQPAPVILEEAIDYMSALEMQVRAMTDLADLLSGSTSCAGSTSAAPPSPS